MSSDELIDKIKKELLKSGFPLELQCRREIYQRHWGLSLNRTYVDSEGIEHEIDAMGDKQTLFSVGNVAHNVVFSILIVECKKNEANHWVFFDEGLGIRVLNVISTLGADANEELEYLRPESLHQSHYFKMVPTSSFCMAFKKEKNQVFEAVCEVSNAYKYGWGGAEKFMKKRKRRKHIWVNIYYPVIVFDGRLFIAKMVNDDLQVQEVSQILYTMMPSPDFRELVSIDVVRADTFSNYLESLEQDHEIIVRYIKSKAGSYLGK